MDLDSASMKSGMSQPAWCGHPDPLYFHQHCPTAAAIPLTQHYVLCNQAQHKKFTPDNIMMPAVKCLVYKLGLTIAELDQCWKKKRMLGMEAKSIILQTRLVLKMVVRCWFGVNGYDLNWRQRAGQANQ